MPTFAYSAHSPTGVISGEIAAADRADAMSLLGKKRLSPFKLEQAGAAGQAARAAAKEAAITAQTGPIKLKSAQVLMFVEIGRAHV
jgi:type II secretory pathway component PulF